MLNKNDPLIGAVQEVMKKNQTERDAVRAVNEKFGVVDRRALPHEQQANWDAAYTKVLSEGVESLDEVSIKRMKRELSAAGEREIEARDGFGNDDAEKKAVRNAKSIKAKYGQRGLDAVERRAQHGLYGDRIRKSKSMEEELSLKQKKLAKVGNKAGLGGNPNEIDAPDLEGARKGHAKHIEEVLDTPDKRLKYGMKAIGSYVKASLTGDKNTKRKRLAGNKNYKKKVAQAGEKQAMDSYREKKSGEVLRDMGRKTGLGQNYDKIFKEENLEEKAVSKAQHRFFGLVRGIQKGEAKGSAEATKAAKSMSVKSVRDYAKTKEKGLPEKKD